MHTVWHTWPEVLSNNGIRWTYKKKSAEDSRWKKYLSDCKVSRELGKGAGIWHKESSDRQREGVHKFWKW